MYKEKYFKQPARFHTHSYPNTTIRQSKHNQTVSLICLAFKRLDSLPQSARGYPNKTQFPPPLSPSPIYLLCSRYFITTHIFFITTQSHFITTHTYHICFVNFVTLLPTLRNCNCFNTILKGSQPLSTQTNKEI